MYITDLSRNRHVKCDEEKPHCKRCVKSARRCEGYVENFSAVDQSGRAVYSIRNPTSHPGWNQTQQRTFDHFYTIAVPELDDYFDSEFWAHHVPQLGQSHPAIQHALMALGAAHKRSHLIRWNRGQSIGHYENAIQKFSIQEYSQAIQLLHKSISSQGQQPSMLAVALICCVVFTSIENICGNVLAAQTHAENGLKILNQWFMLHFESDQGLNDLAQHSSLNGSIFEVFIRIGNYLNVYHGTKLQPQVFLITRDVPEEPNKPPVQKDLVPEDMRSRFLLRRNELFRIHMRLFIFADSDKYTEMPVDQVPSEAWETRAQLMKDLRDWVDTVDSEGYADDQSDPKTARAAIIYKMRCLIHIPRLRMWPNEEATFGVIDEENDKDFLEILKAARALYSSEGTVTSVSNYKPGTVTEDEFDISAESLESLIPVGIPTFTQESGIIPCLYYAAMNSSIPIRQAAITLLRRADSREGFISSVGAANVAQKRLDKMIATGKREPVGLSGARTRTTLWGAIIDDEMRRFGDEKST